MNVHHIFWAIFAIVWQVNKNSTRKRVPAKNASVVVINHKEQIGVIWTITTFWKIIDEAQQSKEIIWNRSKNTEIA